MLIKTRKKINKILFRCALIFLVLLMVYANVRSLQDNIYANYEKAVDYGRVREVKEKVSPIMAAIFYAPKNIQKHSITTYLDHFANYQRQNVRIVVVPTTINEHSIQVIEKLYAEIHKNNKYERVALVYDDADNVDVQEKLLQKIMQPNTIEHFYLSANNTETEANVEQYLQTQDSLVVMLADMALSQTNGSLFMLDEAVYFAQKYFYHMQVFDMIDTKLAETIDMDYTALLSISDNKEVPKLTRQQQNLRKYNKYYGKELLSYFYKNLRIKDEKNLIWPTKSKETYRLFDRGMIYVRAFDELNHDIFSRSKLQKNNAVVVSLIQIANKIARKVKKPIKYFKIYLLTDVEQINKEPQKKLSDYLETDDGVYIQYGRQSALITADYGLNKHEDLLTILRRMAKINENIEENDIRIYRFKTVEITNEN